MSLVYSIDTNGIATQETRTAYVDEAELEAMIVRNPHLVPGFMVGDVEVVGSQIHLNGGRLKIDVLLVDRTGLFTVVEAKLARNGESRREIVAQGLDYASALAEYELSDLDVALGGRITSALDRLYPDDTEMRDQLEETLRARLSAGDVNVHLALDEEVSDLSRIVNYARRRGLSIGYTWFPRTQSVGGTYTLTPQSSHPTTAAASPSRPVSAGGIRHPALHAAVTAFNSLSCGVTFQIPSAVARYKETYVSKYPRKDGVIHYEFLIESGDSSICAELHVETPKGVPLTKQQDSVRSNFSGIVNNVAGKIQHLGLVPVIDHKWSNGAGGRVRIKMPLSGNPATIAEAMQILIANS